MMKIDKISVENGLTWEKVTHATTKKIFETFKSRGFSESHLEACSPMIQRPRLEQEEKYLFMVLTFPQIDQTSNRTTHIEIDFLITPTEIITFQNHPSPPLDALFTRLKKDKAYRIKILKKNPATLLYEMLHESFINIFPQLNDLNRQIESIEERLFNGMDKGIIKEILAISHNIVDFRKSMTAHKAVIRKLIAQSGPIFPINGLDEFYTNLVNYTKEIWDTLDNYKDTITALHHSHDSLYQWRLNEIIKTLTMFSIVIFTVTFTAALFAVKPDAGMPFVGLEHSFWYVLATTITVGGILFLLFKRKKWL